MDIRIDTGEIDPQWPSWASMKDYPKISVEDLRQIWKSRECKSYREYLEELENHDKQRR